MLVHTKRHKRKSPFALVSQKVGKTRHVITALVSSALTMLVSEPALASLNNPRQCRRPGSRVAPAERERESVTGRKEGRGGLQQKASLFFPKLLLQHRYYI